MASGSDFTMEKPLPNDLSIERLILAYFMMQGSIDMEIEEDIFYLEAHRRTLACMKVLQAQGKSCDLPALISKLRDGDDLEAAGGVAYLASMTDGVERMSEGLPVQYVDIVKEKWALRRAIQIGNETMVRAYQGSESFADISGAALSGIDEARGRLEDGKSALDMGGAVTEAYKEIEATADSRTKGINTGLKLGFSGFDSIIPAGLHESDMMILAARPGVGKTSLLLGILSNLARAGKTGVFFSIEMARIQVMKKLLCMEAEVALTRVNTGYLNKEDWSRIARAAGTISQWKIWIDDDTRTQVDDVRSKLRRIMNKTREKIDFLMVDYLQIMQPPKHMQKANSNEKIAYISSHLKFLNRDLKIPIIACAQLNRGPEKRKSPKPQLSDLRESGQIEQDADQVAFIHREGLTDEGEPSAMAEITLEKHRNGPTGKFQMAFLAQFTKFTNLYEEQEDRDGKWYDK